MWDLLILSSQNRYAQNKIKFMIEGAEGRHL